MNHNRFSYPLILFAINLTVCLDSCRDKTGTEKNEQRLVPSKKNTTMSEGSEVPEKAPVATRSSSKPNTAAKESVEEIHAKDKELIFSVRLSADAAQDREHLWKAMEYPDVADPHAAGSLSTEQYDEASRVLTKYEKSDDTTRLLFGWLVMERLFPGRGFGILGNGSSFADVNRKAVGMICRTLGTEPNTDSEGMHLTGMKNLCRAYLRAHAEHKAIAPP